MYKPYGEESEKKILTKTRPFSANAEKANKQIYERTRVFFLNTVIPALIRKEAVTEKKPSQLQSEPRNPNPKSKNMVTVH